MNSPPPDHLGQCPPAHLRQAAWEMGLALFNYEWSDYQSFVDQQPLHVILPLLEWLAYYSAASDTELRSIRSLPALIRAHLNHRRVAQLRRDQRTQLIHVVSQIHLQQKSGELTHEQSNHPAHRQRRA